MRERWLRILVYEGETEWIKETLARSIRTELQTERGTIKELKCIYAPIKEEHRERRTEETVSQS